MIKQIAVALLFATLAIAAPIDNAEGNTKVRRDPSAGPDANLSPRFFAGRDRRHIRHITGQFVRALSSHFHLNCFRCKTCDQVVAEKFFPLPNEDSSVDVFCEKDYFAKLDLLCAKRGLALRGPHINASGKKYGGCRTAGLKNFVEMNRDVARQQWHPECYMIYKVLKVSRYPRLSQKIIKLKQK
ncbi:hypothetical protein HDU67_009256 [Dinochytrium kinnereticum]|nr:hypothetical protein HDU67_009256 [Dinochytrium kinnereticum]